MTAAYDAIAAGYDAAVAGDLWMRRILWATYRDRLAGRILDAGCGTGIDAVFLAKRDMTVVGIDSSPAMIDRAIDRANRAGMANRTGFRVGDIAQLDEPPDSYDGLISAFGALNTVMDRHRFAKRAASALRPGGVAILHLVNRRSLWEIAGALRHGTVAELPRNRTFPIGGEPVSHLLTSPDEEYQAFSSQFRLIRARGFGIFRPPHTIRRLPRVAFRLLSAIERPLRGVPPFRDLGRFFVLELARR